MHGLRDSFIGLKAELADKDFILIQNGISVENEKREESISQRGRRGVTRIRPGNRLDVLQYHSHDINIAQFFVQRFNLFNMGGINGDRDRVVVAFAARFYRRRVITRRMALYHFNHLINQLR
ncbi:hypothetical protein STM14_0742 [Salmonella enterica subsp. enterica serovar Typhimurium str. 14028S]|nr:hypothetical protein STM14_0742 [Salmonella enterica subsp. enterica serovar Typhimurium str. 14028S]